MSFAVGMEVKRIGAGRPRIGIRSGCPILGLCWSGAVSGKCCLLGLSHRAGSDEDALKIDVIGRVFGGGHKVLGSILTRIVDA